MIILCVVVLAFCAGVIVGVIVGADEVKREWKIAMANRFMDGLESDFLSAQKAPSPRKK